MTQIENEYQYRWALNRVEELLPLVKDNTHYRPIIHGIRTSIRVSC